MTWPARTWIVGELADATMANAFWRDPLTDLRAGGIAMAGQTANDFVHALSTVQLSRRAAVSGRIPRFNGVTNTWEMIRPIEVHYPIGIVYRSVLPTNPSVTLGFGTWQAFGSGMVTVSFDGSDPDFDELGGTGGAKAVTMTEAHLPAHTHLQNAHNHTQNSHGHTVSSMANTINSGDTSTPPPLSSVIDNSGTEATNNTTATNNSATATNQSTGGGGSHANLMPYIACYAWKRVA